MHKRTVWPASIQELQKSRVFGRFCQNDLRFKACTFQATFGTNKRGKNDFFLSDFLKKTIYVTHRMGPSIKYVRKIYRKSNISYYLIRARAYTYQRVQNATFLVNFWVRTLWMAPNSVCVDALMMHLKAIILPKKMVWFGNKLQKEMG